jgi:hypothetical protein
MTNKIAVAPNKGAVYNEKYPNKTSQLISESLSQHALTFHVTLKVYSSILSGASNLSLEEVWLCTSYPLKT